MASGRSPGCSGAGGIIERREERTAAGAVEPASAHNPKDPRSPCSLAADWLSRCPSSPSGLWTATGVAAAQEADLDAVLSRAVELHQSGDLEGASALYIQVLRAVPSAWRVRSNLGAAWAGLGRYEDAIDQYRQALQQEDDPSIRRNMAVALAQDRADPRGRRRGRARAPGPAAATATPCCSSPTAACGSARRRRPSTSCSRPRPRRPGTRPSPTSSARLSSTRTGWATPRW